MTLRVLELEEDEPSIIEPRPPIHDTVLAEIQPVAEVEREGEAEFGGDLLAVLAACLTHACSFSATIRR